MQISQINKAILLESKPPKLMKKTELLLCQPFTDDPSILVTSPSTRNSMQMTQTSTQFSRNQQQTGSVTNNQYQRSSLLKQLPHHFTKNKNLFEIENENESKNEKIKVVTKHHLQQVRQIQQRQDDDDEEEEENILETESDKSQGSDRMISQESSLHNNSELEYIFKTMDQLPTPQGSHKKHYVQNKLRKFESNLKDRNNQELNEIAELNARTILTPNQITSGDCLGINPVMSSANPSVFSTTDLISNQPIANGMKSQVINDEYKEFVQNSKIILKRGSTCSKDSGYVLTKRCQSSLSPSKLFFTFDMKSLNMNQINNNFNNSNHNLKHTLVFKSQISSPEKINLLNGVSIKDNNSPTAGRELRFSSGKKPQIFGSLCDLEKKAKSINEFLQQTNRNSQKRNIKPVVTKTLGQAILNYRYKNNLESSNNEGIKRLQTQDSLNINRSETKLIPSEKSQFSVDLQFYRPTTSIVTQKEQQEQSLDREFFSVDNVNSTQRNNHNFFSQRDLIKSIDDNYSFSTKDIQNKQHHHNSRVKKYQNNQQKHELAIVNTKQPLYRNVKSSLSTHQSSILRTSHEKSKFGSHSNQNNNTNSIKSIKLNMCKSPDIQKMRNIFQSHNNVNTQNTSSTALSNSLSQSNMMRTSYIKQISRPRQQQQQTTPLREINLSSIKQKMNNNFAVKNQISMIQSIKHTSTNHSRKRTLL